MHQHVHSHPPKTDPPTQPTTVDSSTAVALAAAAVDTRSHCVRAGISIYLRSATITGTKQAHPQGGAFRRPPPAEFGVRTRSFADYTLCCHVGPAWHGRAAAGNPVALGRAFLYQQGIRWLLAVLYEVEGGAAGFATKMVTVPLIDLLRVCNGFILLQALRI